MRIAILGGTGKEGTGLALRLAAGGYPVAIGSRDAGKAAAAVRSLAERHPGLALTSGENADVVKGADVVFLSVPFDSAASLLTSCRGSWKSGVVVVDSTVPLRFEGGRPALSPPPEGSASEHLSPLLPAGCAMVAAFKTIPAHVLADASQYLDCDLLVCSDEPEAKSLVMTVAERIPGLRALDGGPLRNARVLEAMCLLAITLNRRYKTKSARFRVVGV